MLKNSPYIKWWSTVPFLSANLSLFQQCTATILLAHDLLYIIWTRITWGIRWRLVFLIGWTMPKLSRISFSDPLKKEEEGILIIFSKPVIIHDYEYYHDSYMVSISAHKYDWRQRNMQLSSIINVKLLFMNIFYKILYEIIIWIVRQSTILFTNSFKLLQ